MNSSIRPSRAILFDFDGVILDSLASVLEAFSETSEMLSLNCSLEAGTLASLTNVTYEAMVEAAAVPKELEKRFLYQFLDIFRAKVDSAPLFEGIEEVLSALAKSASLAIVSASPSEIIRQKLTKHSLLPLFSAVYGGEQQGTKADKINHFIKINSFLPSEATMVGDSVSDIAAGIASGTRTVAVTWGWQSQETLEGMSPDKVFSNVRELLSL